jgi:hypothetical protein
VYRPESVKKLTRKELVDMIKNTAKALKCDPHYYSTHSLRIGGTTTLATAGASVDLINRIGRWSHSADTQRVYNINLKDDHNALSFLPLEYGFDAADTDLLSLQPQVTSARI